MMLNQVDPARIRATILRLTQFGTRHTLSSQTDPVRGIGAATAWVTEQMQAFAATSGGNMTVHQQTFVQPAGPRIPVPTSITNVIATLKGTASPERFYVVDVPADKNGEAPPAIGQPAKRDGQQQIDEGGAGEQQREVLRREVLAALQGKIKKSVPDSQHA
jgi:hypothetical protein